MSRGSFFGKKNSKTVFNSLKIWRKFSNLPTVAFALKLDEAEISAGDGVETTITRDLIESIKQM